jgi:hypothetical protein
MIRVLCGAGLTVLALGVTLYSTAQTGEVELAEYVAPGFVPKDAAGRLQERIGRGEAKLTFESKGGYLRSLLQALGISSASQTLVFSKTSLQIQGIGPRSPRALYFSDTSYVGWVNGGEFLEIASADPVYGMQFYTLKNAPTARPKLVRQTYECLQCHGGTLTDNVPGVVMRSVYPHRDGRPALQLGSYVTTDSSPMKERWGGWYVTGTHGAERHLGNAFVRGEDNLATLDDRDGANVTNLARFFDTDAYLTPHSDLVALLVAEHQMTVQNRLTRASFGVRSALRDMKIVHPDRKEGEYSESCLSRVRSVCEPLVQALFLADEEPLRAPVAGTSRFAAQYERSGPLKKLDLKTRLYALRCSPLVLLPALESLPPVGREYLTRRFSQILDGNDEKIKIAEAERAEIRAVLEKNRPWLLAS